MGWQKLTFWVRRSDSRSSLMNFWVGLTHLHYSKWLMWIHTESCLYYMHCTCQKHWISISNGTDRASFNNNVWRKVNRMKYTGYTCHKFIRSSFHCPSSGLQCPQASFLWSVVAVLYYCVWLQQILHGLITELVPWHAEAAADAAAVAAAAL